MCVLNGIEQLGFENKLFGNSVLFVKKKGFVVAVVILHKLEIELSFGTISFSKYQYKI